MNIRAPGRICRVVYAARRLICARCGFSAELFQRPDGAFPQAHDARLPREIPVSRAERLQLVYALLRKIRVILRVEARGRGVHSAPDVLYFVQQLFPLLLRTVRRLALLHARHEPEHAGYRSLHAVISFFAGAYRAPYTVYFWLPAAGLFRSSPIIFIAFSSRRAAAVFGA
jgi:hypothetical protein